MARPALPPAQVKRNVWGVALSAEEETQLEKIRGERSRSAFLRELLVAAYPTIFGGEESPEWGFVADAASE